MIVTDEAQLRLPCEPVKSVAEGGEVARKLSSVLERINKKAKKRHLKTEGKNELVLGIGLAANQIGIQKRVCVVKTKTLPWVLMNPVIVAASEEKILFKEGCLSFPGLSVETERHTWIEVDTLNHGRLSFGMELSLDSLLLSVAMQHEIDHLNSISIKDRAKRGPND